MCLPGRLPGLAGLRAQRCHVDVKTPLQLQDSALSFRSLAAAGRRNCHWSLEPCGGSLRPRQRLPELSRRPRGPWTPACVWIFRGFLSLFLVSCSQVGQILAVFHQDPLENGAQSSSFLA